MDMKYRNKQVPIDERVEDLLSRMTLKEKIGQLNQRLYGWNTYKKTEAGYELTDIFKNEVSIWDGMGALYGLFRADPWSGVNFENGIAPVDSPKVANMIQRHVLENTRLGIPVLISEESPHGHQALDGTLFPVNLGIGSTWNPKLYEEAFTIAGEEIRSRGAHLALVSTLDILHDPRWGRSEECYGEDPFLAARMTEAAVRGLQGENPEDLLGNDKVAAVVKHFCAQGAAIGGHNGRSTVIGERELREIHLPGMKAAVSAGAMSCMAAYNDIDGIPCHANKKLLTGILRDEWGFEGVVMSDGMALDQMLKISGDLETAGAMGLEAGVDLSLWGDAFALMEKAIQRGLIKEASIDRSVRRVLKLKFTLGLFDKPYTDEEKVKYVLNSNKSSSTNLKVARESMVLLKNEGAILPIDKQVKRIAVIGPNADNLYNQLGDYTPPQRPGIGITVLQGIRAAAPEGTEISYAKGCGIRDLSTEGFEEAVTLAQNSDIVILVLGGSSARNFDSQFMNNGAVVVSDKTNEMDCGEGVDVADLELGGMQLELAKQIVSAGTPVVLVLIQGRPHSISWLSQVIPAILCAWYPGKEGGMAVGEILFGQVSPSGKLPVSIPRSSGQLPVYYNSKEAGDYLDMSAKPLYTFGFGLSYTTFKCSNFKLSQEEISLSEIENGHRIKITLEIENEGTIPGSEVIQLYIQDLEASVVRRVKELKGFEKIYINPGERKEVSISIGKEELGVWNSEMHFGVEPGNIKIMAGNDPDMLYERILRITG